MVGGRAIVTLQHIGRCYQEFSRCYQEFSERVRRENLKVLQVKSSQVKFFEVPFRSLIPLSPYFRPRGSGGASDLRITPRAVRFENYSNDDVGSGRLALSSLQE